MNVDRLVGTLDAIDRRIERCVTELASCRDDDVTLLWWDAHDCAIRLRADVEQQISEHLKAVPKH